MDLFLLSYFFPGYGMTYYHHLWLGFADRLETLGYCDFIIHLVTTTLGFWVIYTTKT